MSITISSTQADAQAQRFAEMSKTVEVLSLRCAELERQKIAPQVAISRALHELTQRNRRETECLKAQAILEEAWLKV